METSTATDCNITKYAHTLEDEQLDIFNAIVQHAQSEPMQYNALVIGGIGGSGKTYTLRQALDFLATFGIHGFIGAYTGRAAAQMRKTGLSARTLHKLLYKPVIDENGDLLFFTARDWDEVRAEAGRYICVDEGSMIPQDMMRTLLEIGVPVIVSGDYFQLPAVDPTNKVEFNAMLDVEGTRLSLTKNRRVDPEAEGLYNVTEILRDRNVIPRIAGTGYKTVKKQDILHIDFHRDNRYDIILCGMNKTRNNINKLVRSARGHHSDLAEDGELVICLQNTVVNEVDINNGEIFQVEYSLQGKEDSIYTLRNIETDETVRVKVFNETWQTEKPKQGYSPKRDGAVGIFGFAYAISVHKSQGSTFDNVLFYDEDVSFFLDQQRFRYTACSRAAKTLTVAI